MQPVSDPDNFGSIQPGFPVVLRITVTICFILCVSFYTALSALEFCLAALTLALLATLLRMPWRSALKRLLCLEGLAFGIVLLTLLQPGGLETAARLLMRSSLCAAAVVILTETTSFSELLLGLKRLRVPLLLLTVLALTYRYCFVLKDQAERMSRARHSRTFAPARPGSWRLLSGVLAQLFIRTVSHAERVFAAMTARGWKV